MSVTSSNPWASTPADIALNPVNALVQKYRVAKGLAVKEPSEPAQQQPKQCKSDFIARLRLADSIAAQKRDKVYQDFIEERYPEIRETAVTAQDLSVVFERLIAHFTRFSANDQLRESYFHSIRASQMVWDDLSQENKAKLIDAIRSAVRAISALNSNRVQTAQTQHQWQAYDEVLRRTNICDASKGFGDFLLEDLHEVLTECANVLQLFANCPTLLRQPSSDDGTPNTEKESVDGSEAESY